LWGDTTETANTKEQQTRDLCEYYLSRKVSGIFFAPLELSPNKDDVNHRVVEALEKAHIPIVLLDRCLYQYPRRSKYDLVGIDNRRAGFLVTEHLLRHGCQKLVFLAAPNSAATVDSRIQGFQDAVDAFAIPNGAKRIHIGNADDVEGIRAMLGRLAPDGIVCANDLTAARLMQTLETLDVKVPAQIRIIGIDDVRYGSLLAVPLTTLHQPCREIGEVAVASMLQRIANPELPARDILLDSKLVIRRSCGTHAEVRHN
jgi:DNA-binding LacI/PurR family transcriptional regulator